MRYVLRGERVEGARGRARARRHRRESVPLARVLRRDEIDRLRNVRVSCRMTSRFET